MTARYPLVVVTGDTKELPAGDTVSVPANSSTTPTYGSDLLAGIGAFTNATGWTTGTGWSITGGQAVYTSGGGTLDATIAVTSGTKYQIDWTHVSGIYSVTFTAGAVSTGAQPYWGNKSLTFVAGTTGSVTLSIAMSSAATIDGLTVRAVTTAGRAVAYQALDAGGNVAMQGVVTAAALVNTAYGSYSLLYNTTGYYNTALGNTALQSNTTGYQNTANGVRALQSNTTGYSNTANGVSAMFSNTTGYNNTANGLQVLLYNTTGYNNTANGLSALQSNTTGYQNTATGLNALYNVTEGDNNTAIGRYTGIGITTGTGNTILGANVTGLAAGLTNNIILANGAGTIKAQHDGSTWAITDPAQYGLGSASAPTITFSGDTNTGIFSSGADTLNLTTGGTERMRIDSAGNVGIGGVAAATTALYNVKQITGGTIAYGCYSAGQIQSGTVTAGGTYYQSSASTSAGTTTNIAHFSANQGTFTGTVTAQFGVLVDASLTGAANNYGFYSNIASGSGRWNFYANGTAQNWFAGVSYFNTGLVLPKTTTTGIKVDTTTPTWGWRDITAEIDARGTGATVPTFSQYTGTNFYLHQFSATAMQEVFCTFHVPHDYVPGTDIYLHTHWSNAAATPNTGSVVWGFEYSYAKGHGQAAFPASSTITVTQACNATRYWHHVAETTAITISGLEVDGLIMVRVYRDATNGSDTCTDAVFLHTADVHYQSTNMATKARAPDFYT